MKNWIIFLLILISKNCFAQNKPTFYPVSETKAKQIITRLLKQSPIIDGHNDLYIWYYGCSYKQLPKCPQDITDHPLDTTNKGQTDIPRWRKGGVGGVLLNVYADSLREYIDAYDLLYRLEKRYYKDLKVVISSGEMRRSMQSGKIAILPILEGSVRLENKLSMLRMFYKLGLRCVTFTYHTSDLADGSDDIPKHDGISAAGKIMVEEMNRLGVIIDLSHASVNSMNDILDISKAPVIFSHSNAKALCNVNRNVPDEVLKRLKLNGGLIMINMVAEHTSNAFSHWMTEGDSIYFSTKKNYPGDKNKLEEVMQKWEKNYPRPHVSIWDVADHFDYIKKLIGVDHIGIGGDYDGMDFPITGLEDVSCFPALLTELARRGWTVPELKQITGENFLRVFSMVENAKQ